MTLKKAVAFTLVFTLILCGISFGQSAQYATAAFETAPMIAAGDYHVTALKSDGSVWSWGWNAYGQLGDGTTTNRDTPVSVNGLTDIITIAGGGAHTVALKADGTLWAWGYNNYGQLGDNSNSNRSAPVRVSGYLSDVAAIAAGGYHTVILKRDGTVWTFGCNLFGQLGDGTYNSRRTPVKIKNLTGVTAVAAGAYHTAVLKRDGTIWAFGEGFGTEPVRITSQDNFAAIAVCDFRTVALKKSGAVVAFGSNGSGELGDVNPIPDYTYTQTLYLPASAAVTTGFYHTASLCADGTVYITSYPAQYLSGVVSISATYYYTVALKGDGSVWILRRFSSPVQMPGENGRGMLNLGAGQINFDSSAPIPVSSSATSAVFSDFVPVSSDDRPVSAVNPSIVQSQQTTSAAVSSAQTPPLKKEPRPKIISESKSVFYNIFESTQDDVQEFKLTRRMVFQLILSVFLILLPFAALGGLFLLIRRFIKKHRKKK